jgi:hypothetical protein
VPMVPKIYVSAQRPLGRDFDLLLSGLRSAGIEPHWPDGFRGYDVIAREIDECIALLAVITYGSYALTWQGIEVSLASGYPGARWEGVIAPRPVFIYASTKLPGYVRGLDESPRPPLHVKAEPIRAVEQIAGHLGF